MSIKHHKHHLIELYLIHHNATKTPGTEDKETLPNLPQLLNDNLTPDTKIKQTTSFPNSFQELFSSLKAELYELRLSPMNKICEERNRITNIKAKKDVHSKEVKDNKRLWDELETKNIIIKLLMTISNNLQVT